MKNYIDGCLCSSCEAERENERIRNLYKKEQKMINSELTKSQAIKLINDEIWGGYNGSTAAPKWVEVWEKLGIVKFKAEPEVDVMFNTENALFGIIRVELWPEGLVLWVGGTIVYKSWMVSDYETELDAIKKKREEFRKHLAEADMSEHTRFSSPVLKAFDDTFKLREPGK